MARSRSRASSAQVRTRSLHIRPGLRVADQVPESAPGCLELLEGRVVQHRVELLTQVIVDAAMSRSSIQATRCHLRNMAAPPLVNPRRKYVDVVGLFKELEQLSAANAGPSIVPSKRSKGSSAWEAVVSEPAGSAGSSLLGSGLLSSSMRFSAFEWVIQAAEDRELREATLRVDNGL